MIDFLFFLIIPLCIPAGDSYDCGWQITLIGSLQDTPEEIYGKIKPHWEEDNIVGFTDQGLKTIYIEKHAINFYQVLGCNTLWHEIQHAWGLMEEEISMCPYTMRDHIDKYNRLNFYPNPDLPLPNVSDAED